MGKEDDGDGFRANPTDSLREEGDLKAEELVDTVVRRGEAGGLVGEDAVRVLARGGVEDELGVAVFS